MLDDGKDLGVNAFTKLCKLKAVGRAVEEVGHEFVFEPAYGGAYALRTYVEGFCSFRHAAEFAYFNEISKLIYIHKQTPLLNNGS